MVDETGEILRLLGIDDRRLRLKSISASEGAAFAEEIHDFVNSLAQMGEKSFAGQRIVEEISVAGPLIETQAKRPLQVTQEQVEYCMECSNCTGTCPVSRENPRFAPKQIIKQTALGLEEELLQNREIWSCLGCGHCNTRCPAMIDFPEFNLYHRQEARKRGNLPRESHHGIHQLIARLQTHPIQQCRTSWAEDAGVFRETGEYFYFVGCLPYFDITFRYLNLSPLDNARSVLKLLNRIGIEPVISNDERCCGHDAFWSGDEATFRLLAGRNLDVIKASGAKTVLFSCPEGYATFKYDYPRYFGELPFDVVHMTEFLMREPSRSQWVPRSASREIVTYQDPCRLGRRSGIYESPRQMLNLISENNLIEMERSHENALCCGTSAWMECSRCSKAIQTERLWEAAQTGAQTLITACPKCQIHFTCARGDIDLNLEVKDIYTYFLERLSTQK